MHSNLDAPLNLFRLINKYELLIVVIIITLMQKPTETSVRSQLVKAQSTRVQWVCAFITIRHQMEMKMMSVLQTSSEITFMSHK